MRTLSDALSPLLSSPVGVNPREPSLQILSRGICRKALGHCRSSTQCGGERRAWAPRCPDPLPLHLGARLVGLSSRLLAPEEAAFRPQRSFRRWAILLMMTPSHYCHQGFWDTPISCIPSSCGPSFLTASRWCKPDVAGLESAWQPSPRHWVSSKSLVILILLRFPFLANYRKAKRSPQETSLVSRRQITDKTVY